MVDFKNVSTLTHEFVSPKNKFAFDRSFCIYGRSGEIVPPTGWLMGVGYRETKMLYKIKSGESLRFCSFALTCNDKIITIGSATFEIGSDSPYQLLFSFYGIQSNRISIM